MKIKRFSKNVKITLEILRDEIQGDISSALKKMSKNYTMTWAYQSGKTIFPSTNLNLVKEMKEVYPIKGRSYEIQNIAEGKKVVMVELAESYPDKKTGKIYRTPLVLVLEINKGKIETGRHYCDPRLSYMYLSKEKISTLYKKKPKIILK